MYKSSDYLVLTLLLVGFLFTGCSDPKSAVDSKTKMDKPNIIIIYADDLGYGDLSVYGATSLSTPNMDRLANGGVMFTNAYASSATCSPSRFALLTGIYPWRNEKARILSGSARMLIDTAQQTLPKMLKASGYQTAIVGKWHLGLGNGNIEWNATISPGPNEVGFDYSYIMAATQDRVPTVYIEDGKVVGLDPNDPIEISYKENFEDAPTGLKNPEMLKMKWHHGHNGSIVNGIPRIGFMKGGEAAKWKDEDMADHFLEKAKNYIKKPKDEPFFLYYAMQQPHVPRTPHPRFVGSSRMGPRGDVIVEADWCIGELLKTLEEENILDNTLIIFSSDNGPVLNDGYYDSAVEMLGNHDPAGGLRGGKYSLFEAGTRVPFITYWKGKISPSVSDALFCQLDIIASLASLMGIAIAPSDSENLEDVLLGKSVKGRKSLLVEANSKTALRAGDWMMIPPYKGPSVNKKVNIELGNSKEYMLFNLVNDLGQQQNIAQQEKEKLSELIAEFESIRGDNSRLAEDLILE